MDVWKIRPFIYGPADCLHAIARVFVSLIRSNPGRVIIHHLCCWYFSSFAFRLDDCLTECVVWPPFKNVKNVFLAAEKVINQAQNLRRTLVLRVTVSAMFYDLLRQADM